jgi:hypothetical protein
MLYRPHQHFAQNGLNCMKADFELEIGICSGLAQISRKSFDKVTQKSFRYWCVEFQAI